MCHFLEEISSVYYSKDQVKVCTAVIQYKGVNGVLETQEVIKVIVGCIKPVSIGTAQSHRTTGDVWCETRS